MPIYAYHCPANGQTVEVWHSILKTLNDWGEVCETAGLPLGTTPAGTPVHRRLGAGMVMRKPGAAAAHGWAGGCCGAAGC